MIEVICARRMVVISVMIMRECMIVPAVNTNVIVFFSRNMRMYVTQGRDHEVHAHQKAQNADQARHGAGSVR